MEEFCTQQETLSENTEMTLQAIKDISNKIPENQINEHQLEIPGMEEFLAKQKTQSETTDLKDYSNSITKSDRTPCRILADFAA